MHIAHGQAIYPMVIIVMVSMKKTQKEPSTLPSIFLPLFLQTSSQDTQSGMISRANAIRISVTLERGQEYSTGSDSACESSVRSERVKDTLSLVV